MFWLFSDFGVMESASKGRALFLLYWEYRFDLFNFDSFVGVIFDKFKVAVIYVGSFGTVRPSVDSC